MKIAIIGFSGAGKSTLARKISERYRIPVLHLDQIFWLPGWQERSRDDAELLVAGFLDSNEQWVIDGNYSSLVFERRLEEADMIIVMAFGPFASYMRVFKRWLKYRNTSRPDMTEGCTEKLDWEFTRWIFVEGRTEEKKKELRDIKKRYPRKTVIIRNQKELEHLQDRMGIKKSCEKDGRRNWRNG